MLSLIDRPIDSTALSDYMRCPRLYYYGMVLHRRSGGKSAALCYGTTWHKILETHYRTGGDEQAVMRAGIASWEEHGSPDDYRTLNRALKDYEKYRKEFGADPSKESAKTLGWPDAPLVEQSVNLMGNGLVHPYAGKLDRIVDIDGLIYVQDHKTTSRLDKHYFGQFALSQQMMGYTFLAQLLLPNLPVVGVQINLAHVLTTKTEFQRQLVTFSKERLLEWAHNTNNQSRRINGEYELLAAEAELGAAPFPGDGISCSFPGHYGDNGCSGKFGTCGYASVCQISPRVRKRALEQDFAVAPWNPLEADGE